MTDHDTNGLSLYQYNYCPFCIITKRAIKRLDLDVEIRDTQKEPKYRQELIAEGGMSQVPCLRIEENDSVEWMYESADIIKYLNNRFG